MQPYTVAVRALCEFTAKEGDLDLRFTPAPSAQEGVAGHQAVAARRGAGYRAELALAGEHRHLIVRGRADGWDAQRCRLEEVKTFKGELDRMPANHRLLHWAQAQVYGWLVCRQLGLPRITVALVYYDVRTQQETTLERDLPADELRRFFEALADRFIAWADRELAHRGERDRALAALLFPHASFRAGQRRLAESVFRAARHGRCLMAQAPTGIGKTIATLFPLLKASPEQSIDKIFFVSAKGSGRALALDAIAALQARPLRVVELVAREKACEYPGRACHGDACPLARGFYDRLPAARDAAVAHGLLDREALREVALAHEVCPYYLSQELVRWADVVVGDYHYVFDGSALLHALAEANGWRVAVLVDEAHNLVDRARAMYSAALSPHDFRAARAAAPAALKKPFDKLHRAWRTLAREQAEPYRVQAAPPPKLVGALHDAIAAINDVLADDPQAVGAELLRFWFDALAFARLLESFDDAHSLFDVSIERPGTRHAAATPCIRNVVPAPFLRARFAATRTTVLFSATLAPAQFYADTLGLPGDAAWVDIDAPFEREQLAVRIVRSVSTRWKDRGDSLVPIADLIAAQFTAQPGNYLAFFSSFDYLEQAAAELASRHPDIPRWAQTPRMDEASRDAFLARFVPDGAGIGFAVLGGSFAEGVDLPGRRLIGAFIATLGLPQVNAVNEEMRERMEAAFGAGYDYTYLFPGLRKVVQAAGRVIRTPSDRGSVHLIDDRYARAQVRALLPRWWDVRVTS